MTTVGGGITSVSGVGGGLNTSNMIKPFENPYMGHRNLSEKEQEVLGEYAKLSSTIKRIVDLSNSLCSSEKHDHLLQDLRVLERKMGLVLTLFKASVWSLIQNHQDELEEEQQQQQQYQQEDQSRYD